MFSRTLDVPGRSFFLFGPRATGKSTWLAQRFPEALRLDLLRSDLYFDLAATPAGLRDLVLAQPGERWIVLDEVQRVPALLDEVQALIEDRGYRFALSGSSARKLKRGRANLLAGRASTKNLFPLVREEFGSDFLLEDILRYGSMPVVLADPSSRVDFLEAYAGTYLQQEIQQEALTRNVQSFGRFLRIAALASAQVTNLSGISRDAAVPRATVSTYFEILIDTLIGRFLPAWTPRARIKEQAHPKFYFFDTGVARAIQGRLRDAPTADERGHLLETYLFHELASFLAYRGVGGELNYWRTQGGVEVDFIWSRGPYAVAIESKASQRWRSRDDLGLAALAAEVPGLRAHGVYMGRFRLRRPWGIVYPVDDFLGELWDGQILHPPQ